MAPFGPVDLAPLAPKLATVRLPEWGGENMERVNHLEKNSPAKEPEGVTLNGKLGLCKSPVGAIETGEDFH